MRGQPGQGGEQAERGDDAEQAAAAGAEPMRAQRERQHPDRERACTISTGQKSSRRAGHQHAGRRARAADAQVVVVPARQIAAGVVLQQRKAVPQRRRHQQRHADKERQAPTGRGGASCIRIPGRFSSGLVTGWRRRGQMRRRRGTGAGLDLLLYRAPAHAWGSVRWGAGPADSFCGRLPRSCAWSPQSGSRSGISSRRRRRRITIAAGLEGRRL